jgi:hypothetical protein
MDGLWIKECDLPVLQIARTGAVLLAQPDKLLLLLQEYYIFIFPNHHASHLLIRRDGVINHNA